MNSPFTNDVFTVLLVSDKDSGFGPERVDFLNPPLSSSSPTPFSRSSGKIWRKTGSFVFIPLSGKSTAGKKDREKEGERERERRRRFKDWVVGARGISKVKCSHQLSGLLCIFSSVPILAYISFIFEGSIDKLDQSFSLIKSRAIFSFVEVRHRCLRGRPNNIQSFDDYPLAAAAATRRRCRHSPPPLAAGRD